MEVLSFQLLVFISATYVNGYGIVDWYRSNVCLKTHVQWVLWHWERL